MNTPDKNELRALMAQRKKSTSNAARLDLSAPVLRRLAKHPRFKAARTVLLYHSLPGEVNTHDFIRFWCFRKTILLPTVKGNDIELHRYAQGDKLAPGAYGIKESLGELFTDFASIDLAVIPGIAFDAKGNRLGHGKGYYDRLLARLAPYNVYKLGICFGYQRVPAVPAEDYDVPMDEVL